MIKEFFNKKFQAYFISNKKLFQTNISSTSHAPAVNCSKMSSIFYRASAKAEAKSNNFDS